MTTDQQPNHALSKDHEGIFSAASPEARLRLEAIQAIVEQRVTGTRRCVSYDLAAFRKAKIFFYFGSFTKHIGIYPPLSQPQSLVDDLKAYRGPKGNLIFPHNAPLPIELIGRVALALAEQYGA
jgi:uncharacterized protein YdhG (YjbR/CyaY superfamily)